MASTRSPPISSPLQASSYSSSQRRPVKKSSFLSLQREMRANDALCESEVANYPSSKAHAADNSRPKLSDHDIGTPSRPVLSHSQEIKSFRLQNGSRSIDSAKEVSHGRRRTRGNPSQPRSPTTAHQAIEFPSEFGENVPWPTKDDEPLDSRPRTTSGPSNRRRRDHHEYSTRSAKYPFRDSGSSSMSHFETPPRTPIDDYPLRERSYPAPVVVAAPIAGVETMDALVDGMNGFTEDEEFLNLTSASSRTHYQKTGFHPLYHPPLPTPPPGVKLGGGYSRGVRRNSDTDSDHVSRRLSSPKRPQRERHKKSSSRSSKTTSSSITKRFSAAASIPGSLSASLDLASSRDDGVSPAGPSGEVASHKLVPAPAPSPPPREVVPSISEIIRTHAPPEQRKRTRATLSQRSSYAASHNSSVLHEAAEIRSEPTLIEEESDLISRSSVDTIAEEVRQTIRNQVMSPLAKGDAPVGSYSQATTSEYSRSPLSEGRQDSSLYNFSMISDQPAPPPMELSSLTKAPINSPSQAIAQYLRSSRLTTIMRLTRGPHASRDCPLSVSFSDLGNPDGFPVVVFLGLGCVRHIMGLYDEMAECLNIRLITIDRWGLGRSDYPRSKMAKGIPEWASVVGEVLDRLRIEQCGVMAHSAGAPYALAFANRFPERIGGDICLLAPWVGGGEGVAGYKWLKYVPNGILKTAQAAEWKVQAWMLGKPPTIAYEGIGFDVQTPTSPTVARSSPWPTSPTSTTINCNISAKDMDRCPSSGSSAFSDYDDLQDFNGRFDSGSTLGRKSMGEQRNRTISESKTQEKARKPSRGFLGRLRSGNFTGQPRSNQEELSPNDSGKKLKALRSMGSLKGRSATVPVQSLKKLPSTQWLKHSQDIEIGLGLDSLDWDATIKAKTNTKSTSIKSVGSPSLDLNGRSPRSSGRRSMSFGASLGRPSVTGASTPVPSIPPLPPSPSTSATLESSYQIALGNALIAASHAESSKGTHQDLLQILNHERLPWGFSYSAYPHKVRIWHGDRDEKIAENAVRWMESTMGPEKCQVNVVKGADHSLMFKSGVVVEVLEYISECWKSG